MLALSDQYVGFDAKSDVFFDNVNKKVGFFDGINFSEEIPDMHSSFKRSYGYYNKRANQRRVHFI